MRHGRRQGEHSGLEVHADGHCDYTYEWYDGRLSLAGGLGVLSGTMCLKPLWGILLEAA